MNRLSEPVATAIVDRIMAVNVALASGEITHEQAHVLRSAVWRDVPSVDRYEITARLTSAMSRLTRPAHVEDDEVTR